MEYTRFDIGSAMKKRNFAELTQELLHVLGDSLSWTDQISTWKAVATLHEEKDKTPSGYEVYPCERQRVVFRVSCLDCLDRTNLTQTLVAVHVVEAQLRAGLTADGLLTQSLPRVKRALRELWAAQGRALSLIYAGSDAHFQQLLLSDGRCPLIDPVSGAIALRRFAQQNFLDGWKQDAVSLITCAYEPGNGGVELNPFERRVTYLNVFIGFGFITALLAFCVNVVTMMVVDRYRFRADFVALVLLWGVFLIFVLRLIGRDPTSFTNYPVLR
jgi:hypothetical protein